MLEIQNLEYPEHRHVRRAGLYTEIFDRLQPGQCVKVGTDVKETNRVACALRSYLRSHRKSDLVVKQIACCDDGVGRIWLLPKEKKPVLMADVPGRRISKLGVAQ